MVEHIMKKEIFGTFHAKCGTRDLTQFFRTVTRKAGLVVTLVQLPDIHPTKVLVVKDTLPDGITSHQLQ
jgi:hypothetical protein